MESSINRVMDQFVSENSVNSDVLHHKRFWQQVLERLHTTEDEEFTKKEILGVLEKFDPS
jgi:hypothetical protein